MINLEPIPFSEIIDLVDETNNLASDVNSQEWPLNIEDINRNIKETETLSNDIKKNCNTISESLYSMMCDDLYNKLNLYVFLIKNTDYEETFPFVSFFEQTQNNNKKIAITNTPIIKETLSSIQNTDTYNDNVLEILKYQTTSIIEKSAIIDIITPSLSNKLIEKNALTNFFLCEKNDEKYKILNDQTYQPTNPKITPLFYYYLNHCILTKNTEKENECIKIISSTEDQIKAILHIYKYKNLSHQNLTKSQIIKTIEDTFLFSEKFNNLEIFTTLGEALKKNSFYKTIIEAIDNTLNNTVIKVKHKQLIEEMEATPQQNIEFKNNKKIKI